jgi:hypothetical protein
VTPLIREMVRFAPDAESFMWFDIGTLPPHTERRHIDRDALMHLPFQRTAIVGTDSNGERFILPMISGNGSVAVAGFSISANGSVREMGGFAYMDTPEGLRVHTPDGAEVPRDIHARRLRIVSCCIDRLVGVATAHKPVSANPAINRKRIAKGKKPLFDWHTVTIEPPAPKVDPQGGHHASPRKHDRRGHWRTYKSGKRGWVKNCVVGNAALGVVFKDYEVLT